VRGDRALATHGVRVRNPWHPEARTKNTLVSLLQSLFPIRFDNPTHDAQS
jgi:hypothetical protein